MVKIEIKYKNVEKDTPLGTKMKDLVSGFVGIAVARVVFYNGCIQYNLKPALDKDKKLQEAQIFDYQQLVIVDKGIARAEQKEKETPGGDMPDTPKIR